MLIAVSIFRNRPVNKGNITPSVSLIITAYNEERLINDKIENTLKQDYPKNRLEIIVASDCSTDRTDEIVKSYQSQGVKLIRAPERKGKENAQKLAIDIASGEIYVFSDVATILKADGISSIVKNFNDPTVGCVSSVDKFIDPEGKISGEGAYVKYEMFLRSLEAKVSTLVGLSGSFFAARKEVCKLWVTDLQSDFNTLINSVKIGLRGVSDPESIGYYANLSDEKKEFDRKVRTVLRGISVFMKSIQMLNPLKYGLFSLQLFSHKLCRWLVPVAMFSAFCGNAILSFHSYIYLYLFIIQCAFYVLAIGGIYGQFVSNKSILKIPSFFVLVNLSIINAWYYYIRGERIISWGPSKR
ncbi:MAG TPA: glycosyltransferase family 2 protein [Thermodesulfovibrionales bacterium]|nr:glycosyltransferase family 2 protein [Thermodesulfovibrionales bacterium]